MPFWWRLSCSTDSGELATIFLVACGCWSFGAAPPPREMQWGNGWQHPPCSDSPLLLRNSRPPFSPVACSLLCSLPPCTASGSRVRAHEPHCLAAKPHGPYQHSECLVPAEFCGRHSRGALRSSRHRVCTCCCFAGVAELGDDDDLLLQTGLAFAAWSIATAVFGISSLVSLRTPVLINALRSAAIALVLCSVPLALSLTSRGDADDDREASEAERWPHTLTAYPGRHIQTCARTCQICTLTAAYWDSSAVALRRPLVHSSPASGWRWVPSQCS